MHLKELLDLEISIFKHHIANQSKVNATLMKTGQTEEVDEAIIGIIKREAAKLETWTNYKDNNEMDEEELAGMLFEISTELMLMDSMLFAATAQLNGLTNEDIVYILNDSNACMEFYNKLNNVVSGEDNNDTNV